MAICASSKQGLARIPHFASSGAKAHRPLTLPQPLPLGRKPFQYKGKPSNNPKLCACLTRRSSSAATLASSTITGPGTATAMAPPSNDLLTSSPSGGSVLATEPLKAILFDVDGTLSDSDPLHFLAFQKTLQEAGFNNGVPITEDFFKIHISGRHNPDIMDDLFPEWNLQQKLEFTEHKEAMFRRMALSKVQPLPGLKDFCDWVLERGLLRAAVTNAPRANAEQMIEGLGLTGFFQHLVIGSECTRAKPFPDPYQKALDLLGAKPEQSFALEDSPSGIRSAVAASLPTVGLMTSQNEVTLREAGAAVAVTDYADPKFQEFVRLRASVAENI